MDVIEAIQQRRSIRKFKPDPVPEGLLQRLMECARLAPSGHNAQPWRYVIVRDAELRKKLSACAYNRPVVETAPCVIICCADTDAYRPMRQQEQNTEWERTGMPAEASASLPEGMQQKLMAGVEAQFNSAIATEHLVLAAQALGLATCWVHMFQPNKVRELLALPENMLVVTLLPLGYAGQEPAPQRRHTLKDIVLQPLPEAAFDIQPSPSTGEV